jgi:ribosomal protein S18 acetylase RimI-like enzyme
VTPLTWDSEFFGISIARARVHEGSVENAVEEAVAQGIECLYLFVPVAESLALSDALRRGGRLVDLRVELDLRTPLSLPGGIRRADQSENTALLPLARRLAGESRFSADPRFAADAVAVMYEVWLERCFDEGIVVVPERSFDGFVGARPIDDGISIDLVYVNAHSRGQGLGGQLVRAAVAIAGAAEARVATQAANIAAQRLYQSLGFRTASIQAVVHLWLDAPANRPQ